MENERLIAMAETNDGFVLAESDLDQRGPGDFLGTRQSGFSELRMASLSDIHLIEKARHHAQASLTPILSLPILSIVHSSGHSNSFGPQAEEILVRRTNMVRAVFPGTFDPIHYGHIDIAMRASRIFDELIIAVYDRPLKNFFFSPEDRLTMVKETFKNNSNIR